MALDKGNTLNTFKIMEASDPVARAKPVKRMSKKRIVILTLVAGFIIYTVGSVVSLFIPRHGTVAGVADLKKVYDKVGGTIVATATNSLIQQFPFDGPIQWRMIFIKDPMVFLTAKVDTNRLYQFINSHPDTEFLGPGVDNQTEGTNIRFKKNWGVNGYDASIEGNVDLTSSTVNFRSMGGEPATSGK